MSLGARVIQRTFRQVITNKYKKLYNEGLLLTYIAGREPACQYESFPTSSQNFEIK